MSKKLQPLMDQSARSGRSHTSVLTCFPPTVARDVTVAVVTPLGVSLGSPNSRSLLRTEAQVKWTMEVLCHALSLPLDCDTVKLCVDVYTNWLLVLVSPRDSIPPPIIKEPNIYVQKILRHLRTLFLSRRDQSCVVHQALCQQVLSAVQRLASESTMMSQDTWETLLHFLLCANQSLLAPPTSAPLSQQLSHLSMDVLFQVWLLSCSRCFPSQSLWLTWRQMMKSWRYQPATVDLWTRVVSALTSRLLPLTFGPAFPSFKVPVEDAALIPADLGRQRTLQTWFRFLHVLSNPAELRCAPDDGSAFPAQEDVFLTAMTAVSKMVNAFLGLFETCSEDQQINSGLAARIHFRDRLPSVGVAVTRSPFRDRLPSYGISRPRSGSAPPTPVNVSPSSNSPPLLHGRLKISTVSKAMSSQVFPCPHVLTRPCHQPSALVFSPQTSPSLHRWRSSSRPPLRPSPLRGKVDSLLSLFGSFLFDAAVLDRDSAPAERWADGRAEACGTLCRIFSCKKNTEDILPVHLSRFYAVLLQGLQVAEKKSPPVLASILLNSSSLFCCDLPGVNLLLPSFVCALETVLLDRELLSFRTLVSPVDLRRACILTLMSLLPLPQQFGRVHLELGGGDDDESFLSLKPRLLSVLIGSLQTETDSTNTQMILAAMLILVQDSAQLEVAGQTQRQQQAETSRTKRTEVSTTAGVLWVQFVHLLTQHLTSQWRNDSAVCLAAMEVLEGLAKVKVGVAEAEKRRAVTSVCRHIEFQCGRPPPLHSRDLHSIIVAAFYCLSTWLTQHPTILDQQDCLLEVLETVELGISGSKSRLEEEVLCKEKKELNPVSLRVKEAAEVTLNCIMQVSGAFPPSGGPPDEDALMGVSSPRDRNQHKLRYFAVNVSVILGILEKAQASEKESVSCPSLTALIRGPWSRHAWTLQHHLQPREGRTSTKTLLDEPERHGKAWGDARGTSCVKPEPLPDNISKVFRVQADLSIPDQWESVTDQAQLERLRVALRRQEQLEDQPQASSRTVAMTTRLPPPPSTAHFQTARLFLSHMGLLTPETLQDPGTVGTPAQLASLDPSLPGFYEDLRRLDQIPSRSCDSVFVFYVRAGQKTAAEILRNVESVCNVSSHFLDFLSSLGWPARTGHGQDGATSTCTLGHFPEFHAMLGDSGGGVFDGDRFVLKYADSLTDITFIVPSSSTRVNWSMRWKEAGHSATSTAENVKCPHVVSSLLIVWLEDLEDIETFPVCQLLSLNESETVNSLSHVQIVFIRRLNSGLFHITVREKSTGKFNLVLPLVSGSVLSKWSLGTLVREMAINCCHRRQLWSDSAPPPHIKRKHMINDMIFRYRCRHSEPAFYSALFHDP
ncbi:ral GTPase-activating protein subunit beta isoform X2 [Nerophis lumbriciformis]|uniref:ral GTPase-activating protein subunit beta isoform X2 n=1 Tax=Nerophis lumbriciformis TaxID=546530 RepID=UPI002AE0718C|nr:ral GTPase-activating protein subunit beta-like isoform X2 [Nerophis lumbriciformis]